MKIKYRFTIWLSIVLLISGIILSIIINKAIVNNMELNIKEYMVETTSSIREYVKYKLFINNYSLSEDGLKESADDIVNYISINYNCKAQITDMNGTIITTKGNEEYKAVIEKATKQALEGKAIINLKYSDDTVNGILSYPIYINEKYIGVITINKSYKEIYSFYKETMKKVTITEITIFLFIFMLSYLITRRITKPIMTLTDAVIKVGEGNYDVDINIKTKDEVGILAREFNNMQNKLSIEKQKVEKLENSRIEFFNRVTHELKTPLTSITGYSEMLIDGMVEDEDFKKRALKSIYKESNRMHEMVLDLIEVSKGLSFVKEEKSIINIAELILGVCNDMSIKASKYSISINHNIDEGKIYGQKNKIKQVLINIIDNAIKYSMNKETIWVNCTLDSDEYIIKVENKGGPIKKEIFEKIFEPFVKSDNSKEKESRGLGLYICSEIVRENDGELIIINGKIVKTILKFPHHVNMLET